MSQIPFRLKLTGGLAEEHVFEGYDGYTGLAGFARTLTLVAHFAQTGEIRQKGEFEGRHLVFARAPQSGSVVADFLVEITRKPSTVFGSAASSIDASDLVPQLVKRVFAQNLGERIDYDLLDQIGQDAAGNLETLIAVTEAPIRQTHAIIAAGVRQADIISGASVIESLDEETRDYVLQDYADREVICKNVNIFSFDANSGYGRLFDFELDRSISFYMNRDDVMTYRRVFSWGLDQYTRRTGELVHVCFDRILWMDGRAKRYRIKSAKKGAQK